MGLTTSDVGRVRLIKDSVFGEDDIANLIQRNEQMTGGKISFKRSYEVRLLNEYIIDGIDVTRLPFYERCYDANFYNRIVSSRIIKEVKNEALQYFGPTVGPVFIKHNLAAIRYCSALCPSYEEMYVRGAVRKPEYMERYRKIHANYLHAQNALHTCRQNPTLKNIIATAIKDIEALNKDNSLKQRPNPVYDSLIDSTKSS